MGARPRNRNEAFRVPKNRRNNFEKSNKNNAACGQGYRSRTSIMNPKPRRGLRKLLWKSIMNNLREAAYRLDPVLWVLEILGITPTAWQETFLRSPRGSSILALTARQVGKTTTAA
jgi:hypothetical protein